LICRKDGKIHWETWNGSGWAYNHNEVRYWAEIVHPETQKSYEEKGIDFEAINKKFKEVLSQETPESLEEWYQNYKNKKQ